MNDEVITADPETDDVEAETPAQIASRWDGAVKAALRDRENFYRRGDRISRRYRDEKETTSPVTAGSKFNLFWSNVQILAPATYSRRPKVEVARRWTDADPVGRLAAQILQRTLQYEVDCDLNFHNTLKQCVLDRLLPGMAQAWVRYEPSFKSETVEVPDPDFIPDPFNPVPPPLVQQEVESISDEKTPIDYVFYKDFITSAGRTWADVCWVGRRMLFSKDKLKARFETSCAELGGDINDVNCEYDPSKADDSSRTTSRTGGIDTAAEMQRRAVVWELHDKDTKQIIWISPGYQFPLDIRDVEVELTNFFPCPLPLLATTTNDKLLPVADFVFYQSQLRELDSVTNRISLLTSALRIVGVYDASQSTLATLLQSGMENRMVPVNQWAAFAEKGGLKGVMDFVPIEQVYKVLEGLYKTRDQIKQTVFEITGMADIVRGASAASETLGAQQIKAKFANLRLAARQQQVAEFATALLELKADFVCEYYTPETLLKTSSIEQTLEAQQHPERVQEALALLKDRKARHYRISVAEGSMVEIDEVEEQERRDKFMSSISNFFNAMKNVSAIGPEMVPVAFEMLKFVIRGFRTGRSLESSIEDAQLKVEERMKKPPPKPEPDPDTVLKADADKQIAQLQEQMENMRTQMETISRERIALLKAQADREEAEADRRQSEIEAQRDRIQATREAAIAASQPKGPAE